MIRYVNTIHVAEDDTPLRLRVECEFQFGTPNPFKIIAAYQEDGSEYSTDKLDHEKIEKEFKAEYETELNWDRIDYPQR